jgi:hypothetical protein
LPGVAAKGNSRMFVSERGECHFVTVCVSQATRRIKRFLQPAFERDAQQQSDILREDAEFSAWIEF